jgi:hypothetical protein
MRERTGRSKREKGEGKEEGRKGSEIKIITTQY